MSQQLQQIPIYALTAVTKLETLSEFEGRKGNFVKGFLLNDLRNKNGWRTTWESIQTHYQDFINKPGTWFERTEDNPDHPDGDTYKEMMSNQENYRVTNIVGLELVEDSHTLNYIAEILDEKLSEIDFQKLMDEAKINFTSPGVWPVRADVIGTMPNGRPKLDVHEWKALHYSYINDPAFGEAAAKTLGTCEGMGAECMTRLAASTQLEGNDALAPLQEIKLRTIKAALNNNYTPCELKQFHKELIAADDPGEWITSNGQHIFIPDGQSKEDVVKDHFDNLNKEKSFEPKDKGIPMGEMDSMRLNDGSMILVNKNTGKQGMNEIFQKKMDAKENERISNLEKFDGKMNNFSGGIAIDRENLKPGFDEKKYIDQIDEIMGGLPDNIKENIREIELTGKMPKGTDPLAIGVYDQRFKRMKLVPINAPDEFSNLISHESGHSFYNELSEEKKDQWKKVSQKPISSYTVQFSNEVVNKFSRNPKLEIKQKAKKAFEDSFYDEQFAEYTRIRYSPAGIKNDSDSIRDSFYDESELKQLDEVYKKL